MIELATVAVEVLEVEAVAAALSSSSCRASAGRPGRDRRWPLESSAGFRVSAHLSQTAVVASPRAKPSRIMYRSTTFPAALHFA